MPGSNYFRATSIFFLYASILNGKFDFGACFSSVSRQVQGPFYDYTIEEPTFNWDGFRLNLDYKISDNIEDDIISYALVSGKDCEGDIIPDDEIESTLIELSSNSVRLSLLFIPENVDTASYINHYENFSMIGFCARLWINRPPSSLNEKAETVSAPRDDYLTVKADLDNLVGITDILDDRTINWGVNVFRCNNNNKEINSPAALSNGEKLRMCFKTTQRTRNENIYINKIKYFHFTRSDEIQRAVTSYGTDEATDVTCRRGSQVCVIETVLSNDFFYSPGEVVGEGVVYLQYSNQDKRSLRSIPVNLRSSVNSRSLYDYVAGEVVSQKIVEEIVKIQPTNKVYEAEAFVCNENDKAVKRKTLLEGQLVKICVQPDEAARDAGVFINAIESFSYGRANGDETQLALDSYGRVSDMNRTSVVCSSGSTMCSIESELDEIFFDQDSEMVVSGFVVLQYGEVTQRRRAHIEYRDLAILSSSDLGFAGRSEVDAYFETVGTVVSETSQGPIENWFEELFDQWELSDTHRTILYVVAGVLLVCIILCCCACCFFLFLTLKRRKTERKTTVHHNHINIKYADYENSNSNSNSTDIHGGSNSHYEDNDQSYSSDIDDSVTMNDSQNINRSQDVDYSENVDGSDTVDHSENVDSVNPMVVPMGGGGDDVSSIPDSKKRKKKKKKKKKKKIEEETTEDDEGDSAAVLRNVADEEDDEANDDPATPRKRDVCFDAEDHQGTKALVKAIKQTLKELGPVPYSPAVYKNIKRQLSERRFYICEQELGDAKARLRKKYEWREATKREVIDIFWKYYEEQKSKVS